jgi:hypothetical protein
VRDSDGGAAHDPDIGPGCRAHLHCALLDHGEAEREIDAPAHDVPLNASSGCACTGRRWPATRSVAPFPGDLRITRTHATDAIVDVRAKPSGSEA